MEVTSSDTGHLFPLFVPSVRVHGVDPTKCFHCHRSCRRSSQRGARTRSSQYTTRMNAAKSPTDDTDRTIDGVPLSEVRRHSSVRHHRDGADPDLEEYGMDTRLVRGGLHPEEWSTDPLGRSVANPPVYHNSTVLFPSTAALRYSASDWPYNGMWYGRHGNPTSFALEEAFAVLEGGRFACVTSSGVAANNVALLAFLASGDHVLVTDAVYDPTRAFCNGFLSRFGVETTYFSPLTSPDELKALIRSNTRVIFVESPASLSFEVMDIPAISKVAHQVLDAQRKGGHHLLGPHDCVLTVYTRALCQHPQANAVVIIDNTWGPTVMKPFDLGGDVSINAGTKYIGGHSDLMLGLIACKEESIYRRVKESLKALGCPPGPDDCYLALRGVRTLGVRLRQHASSALQIARWLEQQPQVKRVMHPALPSHPQHDLFLRDFSAPTGLFGFQLREGYTDKHVTAMVDDFQLFGIGFSWGGFESVVMQTNINAVRSVEKWKYGEGYGATLRLSVGLEDSHDLIADLARGLASLDAH